GRGESQTADVRRLVSEARVPVVVDADGLNALGEQAADVIRHRRAATILTPHDGEFERLAGGPPGADRLGAVRDLARRTRAPVLLKGPTTIVAGPDGHVRMAPAASPRLAPVC